MTTRTSLRSAATKLVLTALSLAVTAIACDVDQEDSLEVR